MEAPYKIKSLLFFIIWIISSKIFEEKNTLGGVEIYIFGLWVKRRKSFRIGKFPNSTVTPWSLLFSAVAGNLGKSLRVIYKRAGCTNPIITRTKTPLNNFSALPIGVISHLTTRLEIFQIIYAAIVCEAKSFWHLLGNITNCKGLIPWFPKSNLS